MAEWQPIGTAPKDGTEVLLAHDVEGLVWTDEWMSEWAAKNGEKGWWRQHECWGPGLIEGPTHWMPLPAPPPRPPNTHAFYCELATDHSGECARGVLLNPPETEKK